MEIDGIGWICFLGSLADESSLEQGKTFEYIRMPVSTKLTSHSDLNFMYRLLEFALKHVFAGGIVQVDGDRVRIDGAVLSSHHRCDDIFSTPRSKFQNGENGAFIPLCQFDTVYGGIIRQSIPGAHDISTDWAVPLYAQSMS